LLRKKSQPLKRVGRQARALVQDLLDTLDTQEGVGLAAPQIGVLARVCLVMVGTENCDGPGEDAQPEIIALINPEVLEEGEPERGYDGCLSIPGLQGYTRRPAFMRVRALDLEGNPVEYRFEGFDARVAAHEIDHLDGILYFDRLETLEDLFYLVPDEREGLPTQGMKSIAR
jgi:peptide deformylase